MKLEINLPAGNRTFTVNLDLPGEVARPADLATVLHQLASALTDFQLAGLPQPASCQAGCGACCKQLVPVAEPEMHALVGLVNNLDVEHRSRVMARFDDLRTRLDSAGLTGQLRTPPGDPIAYQRLLRDYFALGANCPFLEEQSCSIYPDRPSVCRQYNVTSPADLCDQPFDNDIAFVPMPAFVANLCKIAFADLHDTTVKITPLPLALEWVEENPDHLPPVPVLPLIRHIVAQLERALAE